MDDLWSYVDAYDCLQNANGDPPAPFELSAQGLKLLTQFKHERFYDGLFGDEWVLHVATEHFYEMLIEEIEMKLSNQSKLKLLSFFAHDVTIAAFMKSLNRTMPEFPHFSSMILIEVFLNVNDEPYFLLEYEGIKVDFGDMFDCNLNKEC